MLTAEAIVDGFPASSTSHGAFGWSSVWLLRSADRVVLVDTGGPAYAPVLRDALAARGLALRDLTDVLLTHAHWDHCANVTMFGSATVWIGAAELDWAHRQDPGAHFLSDPHIAWLHARAVADDGSVRRLAEDDEPVPGVRALVVPGHTPGHLAFAAALSSGPAVFAGDAVKNIHEATTREAASTMDAAASSRSIERLASLARDAGALLVPGHDVPLRAEGVRFARAAEGVAQITVFESAGAGGVDRSIRWTGDSGA